MRRQMLVALSLLAVCSGCGVETTVQMPKPTATAPVTPVAFNTENRPTVAFAIPGLHCDGCCSTAKNLLVDLPGVVDAKVDLATKEATVAIDQELFDAQATLLALQATWADTALKGDEAAAPAPAADGSEASAVEAPATEANG